MKLKFTATSLNDLHRLKEFIAKKNPTAASKYIDRLLKAIRQIPSQPKLGKVLKDETLARQLVAGDYIVRYAIKGEVIYVLKIWHGREDW